METQTIRKRNSSTIPFGWDHHPKNEHLLVKNEEEYEIITQMKELSSTQSLRSIGRFVQAHTGRSLTPKGIQKILRRGY
jgi:hypothetical protein